MEKWKSRTDREIPTFPQPIAWVYHRRERRRTSRMNRPRVVYFPSGVLVYFSSGATTTLACCYRSEDPRQRHSTPCQAVSLVNANGGASGSRSSQQRARLVRSTVALTS